MSENSNMVVVSFSIAIFFLLILLLVTTYNSKCQIENAEKFDVNTYSPYNQRPPNANVKYNQPIEPLPIAPLPMYDNQPIYQYDTPQFNPPQPPPQQLQPPQFQQNQQEHFQENQQQQQQQQQQQDTNDYFAGPNDNTNILGPLPNNPGANCASRDRLTAGDLLPKDANSKWAELNPQCAGDVQDQNYLTAGYHIGINSVNKRNASLDIRYEPPNPQIPVSPWLISTIEPSTNTHALVDVGSAPMYN